MCHYGGCLETWVRPMDTFACEPQWVRVNDTIIPPDTQWYVGSAVGGLQGCFMYAVRPVEPTGKEGPITKIVESDLRSGQPNGWLNAIDCSANQGTVTADQARTEITKTAHRDAIN